MERAASLGQENPGAEDWIAQRQALALAYTGQAKKAREMSRHATDLAQQGAHRERAALFEAGAALREAFLGNAPESMRRSTAALELAKDREVQYGAAFALALSGDSARAQSMANDLEREYPEDTSVKFSYIPALRAMLALNEGEPAKAIELLQIAVPYELAAPRSSLQGVFGALYPIYVRGEAYLAARQGAEAAAEFHKIMDHRGIVLSDPIGALVHLQLGRAYAMAGDTGNAKAAYHDFLTLWKDADPDIPVYQEAKAEYDGLR